MEASKILGSAEQGAPVESNEKLTLKERLNAAIESLSIPSNWENQVKQNPYRFAAHSPLIYSIWDDTPDVVKEYNTAHRKYAQFLNDGDPEGQAHMEDEFFLESLEIIRDLHRMQEYVEQEINTLEAAIMQSNVLTERGCDSWETKKNWIEMNKNSAEVPEDCWSAEKLRSMTTEEYLAHVATHSSGRSFCYTFPGIIFEKGEIVTGIGGAARSEEGFQNIRDGVGGAQINFTPEAIDPDTNTYRHRHYIGLGSWGGDVYFPAEVLLDNYAMLNLPYNQKDNRVSSEWRNVASPDNQKSELHAIPLDLGIVFFSKSHEDKYNQMVADNPELALPRVVFVDQDKTPPTDPRGLNQLLEEAGVTKEAGELPRTANIIKPIGEIGNDAQNQPITVFGTQKAANQWD